jgi:hypothetical protein
VSILKKSVCLLLVVLPLNISCGLLTSEAADSDIHSHDPIQFMISIDHSVISKLSDEEVHKLLSTKGADILLDAYKKSKSLKASVARENRAEGASISISGSTTTTSGGGTSTTISGTVTIPLCN